MIRRPPRSTQGYSSAASDVYKRQVLGVFGNGLGQEVVSPARLNKLVKEMDADGKLDAIFGKKGAEQLRDLNEASIDILTAPPGAVNSSNTASVLAGILDGALFTATGVPVPIASGLRYGAKKLRQRATTKKVDEALNYGNNLAPVQQNSLSP